MRTILKNIVITILLIIVVCLILAAIFYTDSPFSKNVPSGVSKYSTDNDIEKRISQVIDDQNVHNEPVSINEADISIYRSSSVYKSGKSNPFGNVSTQDSLNMPEEYVASGGIYQDNTIFIEGSTASSSTKTSSSSSSSPRTVDYPTNTSTSTATTNTSSSTDSFYKSSGLK